MSIVAVVAAVLLLVAVYDVVQKRHSILRNFPIAGHLRYLLETFGPELRQYIVTNDNEERPFSRSQRRWEIRLPEILNPIWWRPPLMPIRCLLLHR